MITESLARSLTFQELAQRLADEHSDPVVRAFAADAVTKISEQEAYEEDSQRLTEQLMDTSNRLGTLEHGVREAIDDSEDFDSLKDALEELL